MCQTLSAAEAVEYGTAHKRVPIPISPRNCGNWHSPRRQRRVMASLVFGERTMNRQFNYTEKQIRPKQIETEPIQPECIGRPHLSDHMRKMKHRNPKHIPSNPSTYIDQSTNFVLEHVQEGHRSHRCPAPSMGPEQKPHADSAAWWLFTLRGANSQAQDRPYVLSYCMCVSLAHSCSRRI